MRDDFGYSEEAKLGKRQDAKLLGRLYPYTRPYRRLLTVSIALILLITLLDLALPYIIKVAIDRYIVPQMQTADIQKKSSAPEPALRQFTVNRDIPEKKALVKKYKHLFAIENNTALIPFDALVRIDKKDLFILRQDDIDGLTRIVLFFLGLVIINFGLNFVQKMIMEYTGHMIMHDLRMALYTHIQNLALDFFTGLETGHGLLYRTAGGSICRFLFLKTGTGYLPRPAGQGGPAQHPFFRNHRRYSCCTGVPAGKKQLQTIFKTEP